MELRLNRKEKLEAMMKKDSKTKNSSRNLVFGTLLKLYQLIIPFIIRTIIIKVLGMRYAGLNSLFGSVLAVLNITELGVGTVMVYSMYKPIEEEDTTTICALMRLYKIYYRIIGSVILILGLAITPFIPRLIKGEVPPDINVYILYFLNLGATVLSYWLFAYKSSLFLAHQRNDVISKINIITSTIMYALQILLLILLKNYYVYVTLIVLIQIINNVIIAIQANRCFPNYHANGNLPTLEVKRINRSIKDIFYGQLGLIITTSVDSIVISAFLGLLLLAQYQNYYYIINALIGFFTIFFQSLRASIGTNIIVKSKEDNFTDYKFITFVVMSALSFCAACLTNLFQPFIELWVGKSNVLDFEYVVLFVIYFVVYELAIMIGCYKDISGKWHQDRFRPLTTAIVNLVTNIILVQYIGLRGILLSTIISFLVINNPWLFRRVFIDVFKQEQRGEYLAFLLKEIGQLILITTVTFFACSQIHIESLIVKMITNLIICLILSGALVVLINSKSEELKRACNIAKKMVKRVQI